jgi:hypothetical protein
VTTTLIVNSFGVGSEGGGGASVVRGVAVGGAAGFEWSPKMRMDATLTKPASIPKIASAANNLRIVGIYSPEHFARSVSVDGRIRVARRTG